MWDLRKESLMEPYIYLLIAIAGEVMGTSALKASDGMSKLLPTLFVILGYSLTFWALSITLKTLPVGIVYAIWSGLGIVSIVLVGIFLYLKRSSRCSIFSAPPSFWPALAF